MKSLWVVAVAVLASPPLAAVSDPTRLDARVSFDLVDAQPADLFASVASLMSAEVDLDPAVAGPVSIRLERVTLRTALNAICESLDCLWTLSTGEPWRLKVVAVPTGERGGVSTPDPAASLGEPISLDLRGASFLDVAMSFGQMIRTRVEIEASLRGREVTIALEETPLRAVLDEVCSRIGCRWTLSETAPRVLSFAPLPAQP